MAECEKVCKYIDLPLQHASADVLRRMRRPGNGEAYDKLLARIRSRVPDVTLRTTFIVGFPGETEQDFDELCDFVREIEFDHVGVFTYSHEEGTRAYAFDDDVPRGDEDMRAGISCMRAPEDHRREASAGPNRRDVRVMVDGPSPESELVLHGPARGPGAGHRLDRLLRPSATPRHSSPAISSRRRSPAHGATTWWRSLNTAPNSSFPGIAAIAILSGGLSGKGFGSGPVPTFCFLGPFFGDVLTGLREAVARDRGRLRARALRPAVPPRVDWLGPAGHPRSPPASAALGGDVESGGQRGAGHDRRLPAREPGSQRAARRRAGSGRRPGPRATPSRCRRRAWIDRCAARRTTGGSSAGWPRS